MAGAPLCVCSFAAVLFFWLLLDVGSVLRDKTNIEQHVNGKYHAAAG
jgi:hypothetical protein